MDKKMWITVAVAAVLVVVAFFGGVASARLVPGLSGRSAAGFAGRQFGQNGANAARSGGAGVVSGKVLKASPDSITVQARDGSSRIVNLSSATKFSKTVEISAAEVSVGTTVTAFGQAGAGNTVDAVQVMVGTAGFGFGGMRPPGTQSGSGGTNDGSGQGQGGQGGDVPFGGPAQ